MTKNLILSLWLIIFYIFINSAHASDFNAVALEKVSALWDKAQKAEALNMEQAEQLYKKIINDYGKITDPEGSGWGQTFGDMAAERLSVIRCKRSINRKEKYKSFDKFYRAFMECFRLRDHKRLLGLINCEFRIGKWESDNIFLESPEAFSKAIFKFVSYKKINEPNVNPYHYNDYKTTLSIKRISDSYSYKHMFFFEKGEFWLLKDYITASKSHLDEILTEIHKEP